MFVEPIWLALGSNQAELDDGIVNSRDYKRVKSERQLYCDLKECRGVVDCDLNESNGDCW